MKTASLATALWLFAAGAALAQPAAKPLTFEVTSVKVSRPGTPATVDFEPGGGLRVRGVTLKRLIGIAYRFPDYLIASGSAWIGSEVFDIDARAEAPENAGNAPGDPSKDDQVRERLRSLLAARFRLETRRETKEEQIYVLVVAKSGSKLAESKDEKSFWRASRADISARRLGVATFAAGLSGLLGRPVIDKTGLTGKYDFEMKWTPDSGQLSAQPGPLPPGVQLPPPPDPNGPSIFTALQDQLGLRVESQKAPVEILIIDGVEKPSEN